jgi:hypothetical protein
MGIKKTRWKVGPTVILTAGFLAVLLILVIITQNIRTDRPTSIDGVRNEMLVDVDAIYATLPASVVTAPTDDYEVTSCPDGRGGKEVSITRTLTVNSDFDRFAWIAKVTKLYKDDGWSVGVRTRGASDHLELKLIGQKLLYYRVTVTGESGTSLVIIRSTSRCSEPAA